MNKEISISICDDHQIVRDGLKQIMGLYPDIAVIGGDIASGESLISSLKNNRPNVIILDVSLPGRSGLEVLKQVKALYPEIGVLILSMYPEDQFAIRMLKAGASGYLNKDTPPEILIEAVRTIARGEEYISQDVANLSVTEFPCPNNKSTSYSLSESNLCGASSSLLSTSPTNRFATSGLI